MFSGMIIIIDHKKAARKFERISFRDREKAGESVGYIGLCFLVTFKAVTASDKCAGKSDQQRKK